MILKKVKEKFLRTQVVLVLALGLFALPATPVHAGAWGEAIAASIMKQTMENISRTIEGALLGTLKVAAVQLLNTQVMQFVGGDGSQPKIITDFRELLTKTAEQNAEQAVVGDLLTQTLRGKGASANYVANGEVSGLNKGGSYDAYLEKIVRDTVAARKNVQANNFAECSTGGNDPRLAIQAGNAGTKAIGCLFNNSANNPIGIALLAEGTYNAEYERTLREQEIKAQSSGFLPGTDKDGNIITPAGSIESLVNDVTTLGNKIIVGADNPGEFLSGVVVSVVNRTVSNLVQKGVGDIQNKIRREIINVDRQISGEINKVQSVVGPAAGIVNDRLNQVNTTTGGTPSPPPYKYSLPPT
ncbi:MAG: hypothetical protein KIH67_000510 [Candidatus Moranbacteria bacterium]|nr:hypothetical protein [Candidatus Moranbacteria bacterium]